MNNLTICDVFEYAGDIPLYSLPGAHLEGEQHA